MRKIILITLLLAFISNTYSQFTPNLKPIQIQKIIQNMDTIFNAKKPFAINLNLHDTRQNIDLNALINKPSVPNNGIYQSNTNSSNSILMSYNNKNIWGITPAYQNQNYHKSIGESIIFGALDCLLKKK
jgi:hypothetical protein